MIQLDDLPHFEEPNGIVWDLSACFDLTSSKVKLLHKYVNTRGNEARTNNEATTFKHISRSYSGKYVVEVKSETRCGVDMEVLRPVELAWSIDSPFFEKAMLVPGEKELILQSAFSEHQFLSTLIWASKEALAKALGDARNYEPSKLLSPIAWDALKTTTWCANYREFATGDDRRLAIWIVRENS
jgi:phosphopantetheinyl transferase